ncbi:MAG: asparagine synthase (glutamine-hydrolyzing) [Planctomycetota bacterium]
MCGIAGVLADPERGQASLDEVRAMTAALKLRGPDGQSAALFDGAALGHARLAIIDLVTGDQPQFNSDESVVVVVNGEIYNYVELRRELESRGHRFKTQSDIEVIPHLYDEHGDAFIEKLRGMFAIALFDRRRRRLFLVRDRLGKKPLYWRKHSNRLSFASEIKGLLAADDQGLTIDAEAIEDFFTFQYIPAPKTAFREIRKIPAAHYLLVENGKERLVEYWAPPEAADESLTMDDAMGRLEEIFDESVKIRLRSDVPLGAFLSSGIDSTIVAATAAPMMPKGLSTTTIAFDHAPKSEVKLAESVAARLGTKHHTRRIEADIPKVFDAVSSYLDEPLGDSSTLPTWLVSNVTREDVKVAISGDGGDESFGGYARRYHQNLQFARIRDKIPAKSMQSAIGFLSRIYPKLDFMPAPFRLKYGLRNLAVHAETAYFLDMSVMRPEDKARLWRPEFQHRLGDYDASEIISAPFRRRSGGDLLSKLLYVDLKTYLADGVLAKVDRMSMANSLEVRSPLLDQEIVELAFSLPAHLKMAGSVGKLPLRELARRRVGADVADAPKQGFAPPLSGWLRSGLFPALDASLHSKDSALNEIMDISVLQKMYAEHRSGSRDWSRPLWLAHCFETWYQRFGKRANWA